MMRKKLISWAVMSFFIVVSAVTASFAANIVVSSWTSRTAASAESSNNAASGPSVIGGGAYYVEGTLNVDGNTTFTNNIASGTNVQNGGAIMVNGFSGGAATINFNTSAGNISFSSNAVYHTSWTVVPEDKKVYNDIYARSEAVINITGTNTLTISSGIASDATATVNHTSGTVIIGNNSGFQGTYNQTLGRSDISGGINGAARYYIGDNAVSRISGNIGSGAVLQNNGVLTYGSGTNNTNITGTGDMFITGSVTNSGTIAQNTLTVLNNSTFSTTLAGIQNVNTVNNFIANLGTLTLTGGGNLNKTIIGSGNTSMASGSFTNTGNLTITQNMLTIGSGASFTTNANHLRADSLVNNGILGINGGTLNENMTGVATSSVIFTYTVNLTGNNADYNGTMILSSGTLNIINGMNLTAGRLLFYGNANLNVSGSAAVINNNITSNNGDINVSFDGVGALTGTIASAYDIDIDGDEDIYISGNMTAVNKIEITSNGDMSLTGDMDATNDIDLFALGKTLISGDVHTDNDIGLLAFGDVNVTGNVSADRDVFLTASMSNSKISGDISAGRDLFVTSGFDADITGDLDAQRDIVVNADKAAISGNMTSTGGDIHVVNQESSTVTGNITAAGNFIKEGAGNILFGKDIINSYTDTVIYEGSVSGHYGNLMGDILNDGVYGTGSVEFYDGFSSTPAAFNKNVNIQGEFLKSGSAVFNVVSSTFAAGSVVLDSGIILANTYMDIANDVDVNAGTVLGGTGTVKAANVNIHEGGTLSAGNSIGTLNIDGNLNFSAGSINIVEIEQTDIFFGAGSRSDKTAVTNGAAVILEGAKLEVENTAGRYFVHEDYEILTTLPENLTGVFVSPATIKGFDAFRLESEVNYADGKAVLTVKRIRTDYAHVYGLSHNQKRAARAIDAVSTGYGGDLVHALLELEDMHYYNQDHVKLAKALDDLSGSLYANSLMMPYFNAKKDKIYDRMYIKDVDHKKGKEGCSCYDCSHNLWIEYSGSYNKVYGDSNVTEFRNNSNGVLVGYDRSSVVSNLVAGAFAGFAAVELAQDNNTGGEDKVESNAFTAGVYGGKIGKKWDFTGMLSGSYFDNDSERYIAFMDRKAEASYGQTNVALDLKAAYKANLSKKVKLSPFAGLLTNYTMQDEIKEDGADSLNLKVDSQDMLNLEARLGVALKCQYTKFGWYVSAAASQMLTDGYGSVDAKLINSKDFNYSDASFKDIRGTDRGHAFLDYSAGADYKLSKRVTLFANLLGDLSNNTAGYYGSLGAQYKW